MRIRSCSVALELLQPEPSKGLTSLIMIVMPTSQCIRISIGAIRALQLYMTACVCHGICGGTRVGYRRPCTKCGQRAGRGRATSVEGSLGK